MDELTAFLTALDQIEPDAPTRCDVWLAHDLLAHLVAGTEETARLVEQAVGGETVSATRAFAGREAPWRAIADPELRAAFFDVGARFSRSDGRASTRQARAVHRLGDEPRPAPGPTRAASWSSTVGTLSETTA